MKNNLLRKGLVFGVMMLFLGVSVTPIITRNASADDPNLLTNPSFESGLSGWSYTQDHCTWTISSDAHSGSYCAKGVEIYRWNLGRLYQDFTGRLIPGTQYKIGGWMKMENVEGGGAPGFGLNYVNSQGWTPADGHIMSLMFSHQGSSDWTYFESDWFTLPLMPSDCEMLWFLFDFGDSKGTAYWDDVFLLGEIVEAITPISTIWADEQDEMIVPYDMVDLVFTFKNNLGQTLHNVRLLFESNTDVISFEEESIDIGDMSPNAEFSCLNSFIVADVYNDEIKSKIIQMNETISLAGSVKVTVEYDSSLQDPFSLTPTDEISNPLCIQYPDFDIEAPEQNEYYLAGDPNVQRVDSELVKKYASMAMSYDGNPYNPGYEAPNELEAAATNIFYWVRDILNPKPGEAYIPFDDEFVLNLIEGINVEPHIFKIGYNNPFVEQIGLKTSGIPGYTIEKPEYFVCIFHAYMFSSLTRTIGIPTAELTMSLIPIGGVRFFQEGAAMIWNNTAWKYYDSYIQDLPLEVRGIIGFEELLKDYLIFPFIGGPYAATGIVTEDFGPIQLLTSWNDILYTFEHNVDFHFKLLEDTMMKSPWRDRWKKVTIRQNYAVIELKSPADLLVIDSLGRRVGSLYDEEGNFLNMVNEIPDSGYTGPEPNYLSVTPTINETPILLPETIILPLLSENFTIKVIGTGNGSYNLTTAILVEGETSFNVTFTDYIIKNAIYYYNFSISSEGILNILPDPTSELNNLKEFINRLSPEVFKTNSEQRKNALCNKIDEVIVKVADEDYDDAIEKLENDIRPKMDGDPTPRDWIINSEAQNVLCIWIDHIVVGIQTIQS